MSEIITAALVGTSLGTQYALLALGFTLIFGILGVVNFAHGGFYLLGGYLAYSAVDRLGLPYPLAVLLAVAGCFLLGYLFELLVLDRIVEDHLATLMLTLGLYLVMSTGILASYGPEAVQFDFPLTGTLRWNALYLPVGNLVVLGVCLLAIGAVYHVMFRTGLGRALRALAEDRAIAASQGLRPRLLFPLAFALACGLAGMTGALVTPILSLNPQAGDSVLATSFLVVILGGFGSIGGATVAAFLVGLVEAFSNIYLGGSRGTLVLFLLVLFVLVLKPSGLFSRETRTA